MTTAYIESHLRSLNHLSNDMAAQTVNSAQGFLKRGWARLSRRKQRTTTAITMASGSIDEAHEAIEPLPSSFSRQTYNHQQQHNSYQVGNQIDPNALPNRKNIVNRSMDRLRRSFRKSFSRGGKSNRLTGNQQNSMETPISSGGASTSNSSKNSFHPDETSVRAGNCQFQVKYLGSCEVFESRGMQVCENALRHLRDRKRSTKAVLYVSGDSLRVVDQEHSRGLILDQTVEKVSFCAPDRRNDKGFAYICRDGATRRWMCHGFLAVKDSGERLSHAVGCSFSICLEKKRKREAEIEVFNAAKNLADEVNADRNGLSRNNQAYSSFRRQLSLSERRQDPQKAIVVDAVPIQRPLAINEGNLVSFDDVGVVNQANGTFFDRQQSSFHVTSNDNSGALRRFHSLRADIQNKISRGNVSTLYNEPIYEGDDEAWPGCENQFDNASFSARTPREQLTNGQRPSNEQNKENSQLMNGLNASGNGFTLKPLNAPVSQSSEVTKQPVSTNADDWLEKALQSTLTVSPSKIQSAPTTNGIYPQLNGILNSAVPPSQPPPPLPPASILASPNKSTQNQQVPEMDVPEQRSRQSIKYQILEETDAPPHSPPRISSPLTNQIDLFGQPVFNPIQTVPQVKSPEEPSAFVKLCAQSSPRQNGFTKQQSPTKINLESKVEKEADPFDTIFATQVLQQSARQNTTPNTTPRSNPFGNESTPVNV